jgi:hypothetical protein
MEEKRNMTTAEPAAKPQVEQEPAAKAGGKKAPKISVVKPKPWDLIALAVLAVGGVLSGLNMMLALKNEQSSISGGLTAVFVTLQLVICLAGLMVLGKTAKEGTIWGNLFSVGACLVGMSGVLLASALWALA